MVFVLSLDGKPPHAMGVEIKKKEKKKDFLKKSISLQAQWVKDPMLLLLCLWLLLWRGYYPCSREFPHAAGAAKKEIDFSHHVYIV